MAAPLAILLSTCNGERYLAEQLDSLLRQTRQDFLIVARDDGSRDGSRALLEDYARSNPRHFRLLADEGVNLGARGSFARLLEYALDLDPAYLMFCDQDDIWHEDKIERQMALMERTEAGDTTIPILVHSDLEVVSAANRSIAPSFTAYQGLDTARNGFIELAMSNLVTGCTALFNAALAKRALPIPPEAIMHDWWLALTASAFGRLAFSGEATVRYRQHDANAIGASRHVPARLTRLGHWRRLLTAGANPHLLEVGRQARAFLAQYRVTLSSAQRRGLWLCSLLRLRPGLPQRVVFHLLRNRRDSMIVLPGRSKIP